MPAWCLYRLVGVCRVPLMGKVAKQTKQIMCALFKKNLYLTGAVSGAILVFILKHTSFSPAPLRIDQSHRATKGLTKMTN